MVDRILAMAVTEAVAEAVDEAVDEVADEVVDEVVARVTIADNFPTGVASVPQDRAPQMP